MTGSTSRGAFLFGFLACLFLAPVPFIPASDFSAWAVGADLRHHLVRTGGGRRPARHVQPRRRRAAAGELGAGRLRRQRRRHDPPGPRRDRGAGRGRGRQRLGGPDRPVAHRHAPAARRDAGLATRRTSPRGVAVVATVGWGLLTGHGIGASGSSPSVASVQRVVARGRGDHHGLFRRVPRDRRGLVHGPPARRRSRRPCTSARSWSWSPARVVWGALLGDFTTFHLFFGGIAVFATPVAAVAVWPVWLRLRATGHGRLAIVVLLLCVTQLEFGLGSVSSGPGASGLATIRRCRSRRSTRSGACPHRRSLPTRACRSRRSPSGTRSLLALNAHTGRPRGPDVLPG